MEHDFSFNKQLRKIVTARAEMNKKIKMLEADIDVNNKEKYVRDKEINRIQKAIRRTKQLDCKYQELSSRLIELNNWKTDTTNKTEAFK